LGQNHFVTEDDWYEGMFIPKDTIIMMNLWAIHYNEEDYPEPEKVISFCPRTNDRSTNQNAICITTSRRANMQRIRTLRNETISASVEEDEFAPVCISQNVASS
jgi:hypothetical protein